jgi:spermidine/putrescine transport system substrate-binding protein
MALKPGLRFVGVETEDAIAPLLSGEVAIMVGWPGEALAAQAQLPSVAYVLPEEGTMLWGNVLVVSAHSRSAHTAEQFINFLLRPAIGAQYVNEYGYATANEAALVLIDPELRDDPVLFPPTEVIGHGEWYLPLSPAGQQRYDEVWQQFMQAAGGEE